MNKNATECPRPLKVIKASAGSGKTYELTYEYIKLLLGKKDNETGRYRLVTRKEYHEHILAVTFTNKATEEMKKRIVKELATLSKGRGDYVNRLKEEFSTDAQTLKDAARKALEELLFNYTTFNVSTIDAFFQMVMRAFAFELDCDYNYAVEIDSEYLIKVAVHNFLSDLGNGEIKSREVQSCVDDYISRNLEQGRSWNVFAGNDLAKFAENITKEFFQERRDEVAEYLKDVLANDGGKSKLSRFKKKIKDLRLKFDGRIGDFKQDYCNILAEAGGLTENALSSTSGLALFKNLFAKDEFKSDSFKTFAGITEYGKFKNWSTDKAWKRRAENGEFDAAFKKMVDLAGSILEVLIRRDFVKNIEKNIFNFGLLGLVDAKKEEYLRENKTVLLGDTNNLLKDVVVRGNVMFMYERIGTWINHYLIDEFQDTSKMQYENLAPLVEESTSCGDENLIIGDEKQCIYRFRNSDPNLIQEQVEGDFKPVVDVDRTKVTNWRSTANVIKFNNTLFSRLVGYLKAEDTYTNLLQVPSGKNKGNDGCVVLNMFEKGDFAKNMNLILPKYISEIIARGYRMQDIAVLVSTNTEGTKVIDGIMEYNETAEVPINVMSAEAMLIHKSAVVRLVISNLRYFDSVNMVDSKSEKKNRMRDDEARVRRIHRRFDMLDNEYRPQDEEGLGDLLKQAFKEDDDAQKSKTNGASKRTTFSKEYLDVRNELIKSRSDAFDLVSIVENIIDNVVPKHSLKEESSYVLAFMDCLLEYCTSNVATVHSFLRWWDDKKARLSVMTPNSVDAVNVMTIHKSKGLEFPCVILPFANWDLCRIGDLLWVDNSDILRTGFLEFSEKDASIIPPMVPIDSSKVKDITELNDVYESQAALSRIDCLNKTYVAFTRAVNELHIFSVNKMGEGDVLSERLTKALSEWDAELVKNIDADFNKQTGLTESVAVEIEKEEQQYFSGCACSVYHVGAMDQTYDPNYKDKEQQDECEDEKKDDAEKRKIPDEIKDMPVLDWHATPIDVCVPMTFSDMQERGVKLHKLFDLLKRKKNKERVLAIGRRRGLIRDNYDEVAALLDRVLTDERTASWFDDRNKVLNERTIFYQEGDTKMNKRPDRIIRTPEGKVIVIDYKFGKNRDDDAFRAQVGGYIRMLEQSGIMVDQGYVWYPMLDVIVQVK